MNANFPRILSLLRKEKNISQKQASAELGVSQALLSHYEKGIRECGLDFLVKAANYYNVSCDYLLGQSSSREVISIEDNKEPKKINKSTTKWETVSIVHKKLILNSLNIIFDILIQTGNSNLANEISNYLILSVYRMFRILYSINNKNQEDIFDIPKALSSAYCSASMTICEANACAVAEQSITQLPNRDIVEKVKPQLLTISELSSKYHITSLSLLNLIHHAEKQITDREYRKK